MKASILVMNNSDLRKIILSFFRHSICENCKKNVSKYIKTRKFLICYNCFIKNWKSFYNLNIVY